MQPKNKRVRPAGMVTVTCGHCKTPTTVARIRWQRLRPRMGCPACRKVTTWIAA